MKRSETIVVDFKVKDYDQIRLKQLDTTELIFKVLDNSNAIDLKNKTAQMIFTRPDKSIVMQDCIVSASENKINVVLSENCVRVSGLAKIELAVKENNETISSFYVDAFIEKTSKENVKAEDTKLYIEEFEERLNGIEKEADTKVEEKLTEIEENANEELKTYAGEYIEKNFKITLAKVVVSALIPAETEYTLPSNYVVGNNSVRVHWENVLLEEGENGNYMEIGENGQTSNKIKFGWDIEPRRNSNYRNARCCR